MKSFTGKFIDKLRKTFSSTKIKEEQNENENIPFEKDLEFYTSNNITS